MQLACARTRPCGHGETTVKQPAGDGALWLELLALLLLLFSCCCVRVYMHAAEHAALCMQSCPLLEPLGVGQ